MGLGFRVQGHGFRVLRVRVGVRGQGLGFADCMLLLKTKLNLSGP